MKPLKVLYKHELNLIKDYFSKYQFQTCDKIIEDLVSEYRLLEQIEIASIKDLQNVIRGFISWEQFDHKKALGYFKETKINDTRTQQQYLESLQKDREYAARKWPSLKGNVPTRSLIVDIFHNAIRRAFEGKFDDAVARLYRCLEMIGQYALLEYNVVSAEVDLTTLRGKIPENTFKKLAARLEENGKLRLGLVEDLEIISELNKEDPLAIIYRKYNEDFKKYILIRNKSILAHGIKPVSKDEYLKLESMSKIFIQSIIHSVDEEISKINRCFDYKIFEL